MLLSVCHSDLVSVWDNFLGVLPVVMIIYTVFIMLAYQTYQYVVPPGNIFLGNWRRSFEGSSDAKINAQSACALNNRYI
jgi:hypothetical protein